MNPTTFGVICSGFLNQVPTLDPEPLAKPYASPGLSECERRTPGLQINESFRKLGVPYLGVLVIRIPLFRVL